MYDLLPEEEVVARVVRHLCMDRSGISSSMKADNLWAWLWAATWEDLIQAGFFLGHLAEKCNWHTAILITKGNGDFHSIGLIEVLWFKVRGILNCRLTAAIKFHETLHGLQTFIVARTTSLETKLLQQIVAMREEVLCDIFLNLYKAYHDLGRNCCLNILKDYGLIPRDLRLLQSYWDRLTMVARAG